ncbi:MAG: hypothetical protein ACRCSF_01290 [Mycobacteriaceae bacterium]
MMIEKTPGSALARSGAFAVAFVHLLALADQILYSDRWGDLELYYLTGVAVAFSLQIWAAVRVLGGIRTVRYIIISLLVSLCVIFFVAIILLFILADSAGDWVLFVAGIWTLILTPIIYSLVSFGIIHFMLRKQSSRVGVIE